MIIMTDTDTDSWCRRYNLKSDTQGCVKCGKPQTTTIPFADGELRGLLAPLHECGERYQLVTMVSTNKEERRSLAECAIALAGPLPAASSTTYHGGFLARERFRQGKNPG